MKFVGQHGVQVLEGNRALFQVNISCLIHRDIDHVRLKIRFGLGSGGQVDLDRLHFVQRKAHHHKGGKQEEHNINEWNNLDARFLVTNRRTYLHEKYGKLPESAERSASIETGFKDQTQSEVSVSACRNSWVSYPFCFAAFTITSMLVAAVSSSNCSFAVLLLK